VEKLEGDVSVAEIEAQRRRSKANIEYDILFSDSEVEEKLIREKVKADAYVMEKALVDMKCSTQQTNVTINGTASQTVTQQDNLIAYI
jgi:hypothetical protein